MRRICELTPCKEVATQKCWECGCVYCAAHAAPSPIRSGWIVCNSCMPMHRSEPVPVTVWRINLKPEPEAGIDPRSFCISEGILGVGWQVDTDGKPLDYPCYEQLAELKYPDDRGRAAAINAIAKRMNINDLCWTRNEQNVYFLGRITGEWEYRDEPPNRAADIANVRAVDWVEVGTVDCVPGKIVNSFVPRRTVQVVEGDPVRRYSQFTYNRATRDFEYSINALPSSSTPWDLFSSEDVEDIISVWLQLSGFVLLPSTRRPDTLFYEFVLKSRTTGETAVAQVKHGAVDLNRDDYARMKCKVFLFTSGGRYTGSERTWVHCIEPDDLLAFTKEHRQLMPARIQTWLKMWDDIIPSKETVSYSNVRSRHDVTSAGISSGEQEPVK